MTYKEYSDFRYFVSKEYYYYTHIFGRTKEEEKNANYYRHLNNILTVFEADAIKKALKETGKTKQDFLNECTKDFE